ncbi:MAG: glycoside hydrolase family protein [Oscillospiraceae bacterium]
MDKKLSDMMLPAPVGGGFEMEGYWVWCGSVVKGEDDNYHMFASRWSKKYPMHPGWLVASEVVRASSKTPEGPYVFQEVVLPARGAEYWDGRSTHNPHIMKCGDSYVLYYVATTNPFPDISDDEVLDNDNYRTIVARSNKRIGIATSKSVFGPWKRSDKPILEPRPDKFDNFFVSNPAPCQDANGKITLVYKTREYAKMPYPKYLHGKMEFGVAKAEKFDAKYIAMKDEPLIRVEGFEMEDPFIWIDKDGYNMMAKDMNGEICGEKFGGVYARSNDGINWEFKKDFLFYSRDILWDDGVVRKMGNLERPFLLFENGVATHAFFATSDGTNGFMNCTKTWNMVIPLR